MSGFHGDDSQGNENNMFGNDYVNFDQFLMQHNFGGNSSQYYNNAPPNAVNYSFPYPNLSVGDVYNPPNGDAYTLYPECYQSQPNFDYYPGLVQNSNLMATASEFVPTFIPAAPSLPVAPSLPTVPSFPAPGTSPLMASAVEFVPRNVAFNANPATVVTASNSTNDAQSFGGTASKANLTSSNRQKAPTDQDALMNALRKTHIDEPSTTAAMPSASGTIKKLKNGNSREGKTKSNLNYQHIHPNLSHIIVVK